MLAYYQLNPRAQDFQWQFYQNRTISIQEYQIEKWCLQNTHDRHPHGLLMVVRYGMSFVSSHSDFHSLQCYIQYHIILAHIFDGNQLKYAIVCAPSLWETPLQCNIISHWLGTYTKWSLMYQCYKTYFVIRKHRTSFHPFTMNSTSFKYENFHSQQRWPHLCFLQAFFLVTY